MAWISQIEQADATGKLKALYDAASGRTGAIPGIIKVMSLDEDIVGASMGFYLAMMKRKNALSASCREMLAAVVSNVNNCYY